MFLLNKLVIDNFMSLFIFLKIFYWNVNIDLIINLCIIFKIKENFPKKKIYKNIKGNRKFLFVNLNNNHNILLSFNDIIYL